MQTIDVNHKITSIRKYIQQPWVQKTVLVLAILLLTAISTYTTIKASNWYGSNADAIVNTYLFDDGLQTDQIVLPGQHANIIKFPIYIIQGILPYNLRMFILVNGGLALLTIGLWTILLSILFEKKYRILVIVALASLVFSSMELVIMLSETTIRNIEFPIALLFTLMINQVLKDAIKTRWQRFLLIASAILFAIVIGGDTYFVFATALPLLLLLGWYWLQGNNVNKRMIKAGAIVIGATVGGLVLKKLLTASQLIVLNGGPKNKIVDANNFLPSVTASFSQIMGMHNATIFGEKVEFSLLPVLVNFAVLLVSIAGMILILCRTNKQYRSKAPLASGNDFVFAAVAVSFFMTPLVYIFSGQVVGRVNGVVASLGQDRYLAYLPLLSLIGFVWVIKTYYSKNNILRVGLIGLFLLTILVTFSTIRTDYATSIAAQEPKRGSMRQVGEYLEKEDIDTIVSGYFKGGAIRFWSPAKISYAPIAGCNHPFGFNVRKDWFTPRGETKTALVIDHVGPDKPFWDCPDNMLVQVYGEPAKIETVGDNIIWIYNYDVRERLAPFE